MNNSYLMGYYLGYMEKAAVYPLQTGNQTSKPAEKELTPTPTQGQNIPTPGKPIPVKPPKNAKGIAMNNTGTAQPEPDPQPFPAPPWMYNYGGAK